MSYGRVRCPCGNLTPLLWLADGLCVACRRDAADEERAAREEEERQRLIDDMRARYCWYYP